METINRGSAKNLVKAFALLQAIVDRGNSLTLAELSRIGDVPKPTARRLLFNLADLGMVRTDGRGAYSLGPQCLVLGGAFLDGLDLRREARVVLEGLMEKTGETCHLGIRDFDRIVYVEKVESPQAVQLRSGVGFTAPLYSTALGKVMLAYGDGKEVERLAGQVLEKRTPSTIVDAREIWAEVQRVREAGYATDDTENEEGIRCVAAPVFDHRKEVVASISLSGPEHRIPLKRLEELAEAVKEASAELSERVGFRSDALGAGS
ncbi:MAG: IclR family transcriptional regulator [Rubrobacteraceae bacterium]